MVINRVVNNNLIIVKDNFGKEIILKGKGIGFQKKPGDDVVDEKIEQKFVLENEETSSQFNDILVTIDEKCLSTSMEIVDMIKSEITVPLNDMLYVTLTDHIFCLIKRFEAGLMFDNSLLWDVKRLYKNEYTLGVKASEVISRNYGISLTHDEASFIALHIINAEMNNDMQATMNATAVINSICDILEGDMNIKIDEDDFYYNRFIMHLKFCLENNPRVHAGNNQSEVLLNTLSATYPKERECVKKIALLINKCRLKGITSDEELYLLIHIVQMLNSPKTDK